MSCDGNRGIFFAHICATAGAGSGLAPADLETLYEKHIGNPTGFAEELANDAKTRKLFAEMRKAGITPPTHSATGLPKKPSRRGYAAIHDEFRRRGWMRESAPAVAVIGDAMPVPGRLASRPGLLVAEANAAGVAVAAPPTAGAGPRAVQSKPGKIDAVAYRIGTETRYLWGAPFADMKDFVKAIPGGTRKPWFKGGNENVWVLTCTPAEAEAAITGQGWQIASSKPDISSVMRAGASIVAADGRESMAAMLPALPLVPMHGADGTLSWMPGGAPVASTPAPAAPPPPPLAAPAPSAKAQREAAQDAARELLKGAPRLIGGANAEATLEGGSLVATRLMRWAATARSVVKADARKAIDTGDSYAGTDAVQLRYYAEAACLAGGVSRCEKCKQFQSLDGSHTCPSDRYDDTGFNPAGFNRIGFNRQGFNQSGLDAEGFTATGYREVSPGVEVNRHGCTAYHALPNGAHPNGYFTGRNADGLDFFGYSSSGIDADGYDRDGYHAGTGLDRIGFNRTGFNASGEFIAGSPHANGMYADGYDADGYDADGYDTKGIDRWRFTREGVCAFQREGVRVALYKDGRDREGMRYGFSGYDLSGFSPTGYNAEGLDRMGNTRKMRSPKTGKLINATYDGYGIDPYGYDRWGFSATDGLTEPDADGRRSAPNGWTYDSASNELIDPEDSSRRMAHTWESRSVRVGRRVNWKMVSTGTPPHFAVPGIDGTAAPASLFPQSTRDGRDPPYPLQSPERFMILRATRDPKASSGGVLLKCPHCGRFTGAVPHRCSGVKKIPGAPGISPMGMQVYVLANGAALDRAANPQWFNAGDMERGAQIAHLRVVYNPQVPEYDPSYRFGGYNTEQYTGRDAEGYDRGGYNERGYSRKGYNREGFDVLGYDADGCDRSGYNRQGKDRQGKTRPLTVAELQRSLAPGDEPLASDDMARHYSRLAQAITGKPVTVKFDKSIPTGATDMRGNIYLNPHPLGKDADPARNMIVVKSIMYHEVGHELTTNPDHWAELKGIAASPTPVEGIDTGRSLVLRMYNIIEDGRMEREMSDRFPGVAGAIAAASRLRDKWDYAVGSGVPTLHQVMGALLYTALPYYRVPQEVVDAMTPAAQALYQELRPIALRGALGFQEDSLEASKEIVRRLEQAGLLDQPPADAPNIEATPPGGTAGNRTPKAPKPPTPREPANTNQPESGEGAESSEGAEGNPGSSGSQGDGEDSEGAASGQGKSSDEPNGRGKGWRKGQKTASDDESGEDGSSGGEDGENGQAGNSGSEQGDSGGDGEGAGGNEEDDEDGQGGSFGGEQDAEGDEGNAGGAGGGSGGEQDAEGDEGNAGGAGSGAGSEQDAEDAEGAEGDEGNAGSAGSSSGGAEDGEGGKGEESSSGGAGGQQGAQQRRSESGQEGGQQGSEGDDWDDEVDGDERGDGEGDGWDDEADGDEAGGDEAGGEHETNAGGDDASSTSSGTHRTNNKPNQQQPKPQRNPDEMLEPEMGEGSDTLGGDGSGGDGDTGPVAISGELFDPITPFTDADLDAALKAADRETAQIIAAQVRRQANYSVLGAKLHRPVSSERSVTQSYRTADGRVEHTNVVQPRSTNAAHIRSLEGQVPLHREVSGKLARQLQTIRAQAEQRVRFQTSGKLDQRRIVAAMRGADEVRVQVREQPVTSMAISLTLDFSGSMGHHVQEGKVYNAANILGATFELLDMPYEIRGHADTSGLFKAIGDDKRDPARMAMTAVQSNGCGGGNDETAPVMGLATSSLMAREEKNKLIVSLMDGDMGDHGATVAQLTESRKQGLVTFGVFLGRPSTSQEAKLAEMFGAGSWVQINDLSEMPQAIGRRLARIFESIGKK